MVPIEILCNLFCFLELANVDHWENVKWHCVWVLFRRCKVAHSLKHLIKLSVCVRLVTFCQSPKDVGAFQNFQVLFIRRPWLYCYAWLNENSAIPLLQNPIRSSFNMTLFLNVYNFCGLYELHQSKCSNTKITWWVSKPLKSTCFWFICQ